MLHNALQRLLQSILVLLGCALMIFIMLRIIPGNPIAVLMGEHADTAVIERMTAELGLDQPVLIQFFRYIGGALRGDFGTSYSLGKPVSALIASAFVNTLILALMAALFAWVLGVISGIIAAVKKNSILDHLFMGASLLGVSMPVFMTAMLLQYFLSFRLKWFPIAGTDSLAGFLLPAVALGWNSAGSRICGFIRGAAACTQKQAHEQQYQNDIITFYAVYFHDSGRFFGSGIGCLSCLIRAHRKIPLQRTSHRDFSAAVQFR